MRKKSPLNISLNMHLHFFQVTLYKRSPNQALHTRPNSQNLQVGDYEKA